MPTGRPRGAPPKLDQVANDRGQTTAEILIERLQLGLELEAAADSAGVSRATLHNWRRQGGLARAAHAGGKRITPAQQRYVDFLDAYERATAEAELNRLAVIQRAAMGGMTLTKQVSKYEVRADGTQVEIERTVTTEQLHPQWTAAAWWLERRMPARYARRMELTGADGGPIQWGAQADELLGELEAFKQGAAMGAAVHAEAGT